MPKGTHRYRCWKAVWLLVLAVLPIAAQEPAATFRTTSRLVEISVTALDGDGNPVTDLTQDEFEIMASGQSEEVALFRFEGDASHTPERAEPTKETFSNRVEDSPGPARSVTALVLDTLNTPPAENARVRRQLISYLQALTSETRVAVYVMGAGLEVLQDFTDDHDALQARVENATLGVPMRFTLDMDRSVAEAEELMQMFEGTGAEESVERMLRGQIETDMLANAESQKDRIRRSLAAMESLGEHLAAIPGRKSLVWISGGFSMTVITGEMGSGTRGSFADFGDEVQATSRRLAQQGVTLYIVDTGGLQSPRPLLAESRTIAAPNVRRFERLRQTAEVSRDPHQTMAMMASITGGRYLFNTNDMVSGFRKAVNDLAGSYTIGFYDNGEPDDKWHSLRVRVSRRGVNLRYRQGYIAEDEFTEPEDWTSDQWQSVIANPLGSSAIPLTATLESGAADSRGLSLHVGTDSLQFRPEGDRMLSQFQLVIAEKRADGEYFLLGSEQVNVSVPLGEWEGIQREGIFCERHWAPHSDVVTTRVVVRDPATGRYGTLDIPTENQTAAVDAPGE